MLNQNEKFLVNLNGTNAGPFTVAQYREMLRAGQLQPTDLVWRQGMSGWRPLGEILLSGQPAMQSANLPAARPGIGQTEKEETVGQLLLQMAGGCFLWIVLLALAIGGGIIFPLLLVFLPIALIGGLIDMVRKLIKILNRKTPRQNFQRS